MTFEEWAATVERGVTINPEMAFVAGAASRDAEIAELKNALGYDWDRFKASQKALREHMQMVAQKDAEVAELQKAIDENWVTHQQIVAASKERDQLREQVMMLRDRISNVLTTRNIEARASMALANAEENFTDSKPEHDAYTATMIESSNAEKLAREALAATADLKDVILCHAEPVAYLDANYGFMRCGNVADSLSIGTQLYAPK